MEKGWRKLVIFINIPVEGGRRETENGKREMGDWRWEMGDGRWEMGDGDWRLWRSGEQLYFLT